MAGRILIADNVATNRIILKVKLGSARYEVCQAASVGELFDQARRDLPDVILTDVDLPKGGIAALHAGLRADPHLSAIPVIGISAAGDRRTRLAALRAGADEVLVKPLNETTLLALIRSLSRNAATHMELRRKQLIAREFGFAEPARSFARRARVAIVPERAEQGVAQRASLAARLRAEVSVMTRAQALDSDGTDGATPDAFVIPVDPGSIQLVAELRAQAHGRQSVIIAHDVGRDGAPDGALATMALDMGANSVLSGDFDADELALRLNRLIRRKLEADALRAGLEQQLSFAMTDPLTGLYNRRYAQSYLERIQKHARLKRQPFTVMMLDLDRFKRINDRHGHAVGDQVLIEVAHRLRQNLREVDLVARHGGEEFLIVLPDTGRAEAARAAERLRRTIGDRPVLCPDNGPQVMVTASIGVVVAGETGPATERIGQLVNRADRALYVSKADGRNQVTFVRNAA